MIQKTLLGAFTTFVIVCAVIYAQDESRRLELRITDASRGYMRPLRTTAERIKAVPGLEQTTTLGAGSGIMRFSLKTTLTDEQIATALGLEIIDARKGALLLAPPQSPEAFKAEARLAILAITDALRKMSKNLQAEPANYIYSGNGPYEEPRAAGLSGSIEQRMRTLGLDAKLLDGRFYKAKDYHIESRGGGQWQVWAGAKWQGLSVGRNDDYPDYSEEVIEPPANPDPRFVGAILRMDSWQSSFWWADASGLSLNGAQVNRDVEDPQDRTKLAVQTGGERLVKFLQMAAQMRFRDDFAQKTPEQLPKGNIGTSSKVQRALRGDDDENKEDYYWSPYFGNHTMTLSWATDAQGHTRARIRAYPPHHVLHLDGEIDCDAAKAVNFDFNQVEVKWTVAPETDAGIFERRRGELSRGFDRIRTALFAADVTALEQLRKGALSGDALVSALKLKAEDLKGESFSAADYRLAPQILGDLELSAGSARAGCESWLLLNMTEKSTARSYK